MIERKFRLLSFSSFILHLKNIAQKHSMGNIVINHLNCTARINSILKIYLRHL